MVTAVTASPLSKRERCSKMKAFILAESRFDREGYLRFNIVAILLCVPLLFVSAVAVAQPPAPSQRQTPADPNVITIQNVCAAALPRAAQGKQFQWSPDGRTIAYFKPVTDGYGLEWNWMRSMLMAANAESCLTSKSVNEFFPTETHRPSGSNGSASEGDYRFSMEHRRARAASFQQSAYLLA